MNYNLYPLWAFLVVAREGSLTGAGEQLGISQPAVSAHLKGLEQRLGSRLLCRSARGTQLTSFGEAVQRQARAIFIELEELDRVVSGQTGGEELKIAASSTPGVYWLPTRLRNFGLQHPRIVTSYSIADSAEVKAMVLDYTVPMGVVGDLPCTSQRSELHQEEVGSDSLQLMCAPSNPLAGRQSVSHQQLKNQTLIVREPGSSTRAQAEAILHGVMHKFAQILELNSNEAVKEAVLADLGIAVLSSWTVVREKQAGLLQSVAPSQWSQERPIYLICRAERHLRRGADLLWEFLRV